MDADSRLTQTLPRRTPLRRLVMLLTMERRDLLIILAFAIGVGVLMLATPVAVQAVVNIVSFGGLSQPLILLGILLFAFLVLAGTIRAFKAYVIELLQRRIFVRVVADLSYRLPRVQVESFDRNSGPELVNRFFDVITVQKVAATLLFDGVSIVLQTLMGLLILAFYHPVLLAFDVVLVCGMAVTLFVLGRGAVRTAIAESKTKYAVAAALEGIARNPLAFKLAGATDMADRRAEQLALDYLDARHQHFRVVFRQLVGSLALQAIAATLLLTVGGWLVIKGQLTLGQLVAAELIVSVVLASFAKISKKLESFYDLLAAVDKLGQLLDLPLERQGGEACAAVATGAAVDLRGVTFGYVPDHPVIADFSMQLKPGERVWITGGHGSGKSSLADIIYGLRRPHAGTIQIDGLDLREWRLESLREHVTVFKGFEIIDGTIADNVSMHRDTVGPAEVRDVLTSLGLLEEIRKLPDGLDTVLNSMGLPLSYGQARRLMLARAMVGNPRLLLLDDLLDDLDADARSMALAAVIARDRTWTVIVLSRMPGHAVGFDRVIELPDVHATATLPLPAGGLTIGCAPS